MRDGFAVDANGLATLLRARIEYANTKRRNKIPVKSIKVYRSMIESYLRSMFNHSVINADAVTFPFVGDLQVLQVPSKKNYEWDRKYNGKDYELVISTDMDAAIKISARWYDKVIGAVDRGVIFHNEIRNPADRLNKMLNVLEHGKSTGRAKRRRDKITT